MFGSQSLEFLELLGQKGKGQRVSSTIYFDSFSTNCSKPRTDRAFQDPWGLSEQHGKFQSFFQADGGYSSPIEVRWVHQPSVCSRQTLCPQTDHPIPMAPMLHGEEIPSLTCQEDECPRETAPGGCPKDFCLSSRTKRERRREEILAGFQIFLFIMHLDFSLLKLNGVVRTLEKIAQRSCECSISESVQIRLDVALSNLIWWKISVQRDWN